MIKLCLIFSKFDHCLSSIFDTMTHPVGVKRALEFYDDVYSDFESKECEKGSDLAAL